jgi:hypothetical protein
MSEHIRQNLYEFSLPFESLSLKYEQVAAAMGRYKNGIPKPYPALISKAIQEAAPHIAIRGGYRCCHDIGFDQERSSVHMENVTFSVGRVIGRQIKASESVVVFTCTIGSGISELSKSYMERGDMIQGYILDTIGSVAVEKAMDTIQQKLAAKEGCKGKKLTNRFSPGYCDWPVSDQHQLFSLLPENFCGITLLKTALMLPIKSISGIIGIGEKVKYFDYPCKFCTLQNCFRRRSDN